MTHLTLDPHIPIALWVALALGAAGLWAVYAAASRGRLAGRRRWTVLGLMAAAAAVPLVVLLNPTWLQRVPPPPGRPLLTLLLDRSASMATADAAGQATRYRAGAEIAATVARRLGDRYEVRLRTFAQDSQPAALEGLAGQPPDGPATDFGAAIDSALDEQCPHGQCLVLLSDGIPTAGPAERLRQAAARAKALAAPVYTITLGGRAGVRDLEVALRAPQEMAFVHQQVPVAVEVRQRGNLGPSTRLVLRLDGKEIDRRTVKLVPNATVEETVFVTQPAAGLYRYEIAAEPLPGEVTTLNNTATLLLRVIDQPVRVLLLEGKPYWDTKFLVRTLAMDESVDLTSVVQLAPGRLLRRTIARGTPAKQPPPKAAPGAKSGGGADPKPTPSTPDDQWTIAKDVGGLLTDPATLGSYQIVILGRSAEVFLTDEALARLKKWLTDDEGALVCFRGPPSSQINQRLGELMPVRWVPGSPARLRVNLTEEGLAARWIGSASQDDSLAAMPALATGLRPEQKPYLATILAAGTSGGQTVPMITYQPVGSGRVVAVEGAGMWHWALLPPQHQDRDEVYGALWRSLVRWLVAKVGLSPSQRWAVQTDKVTFHTGEDAAATLLVRETARPNLPLRLELSAGGPGAAQSIPCRPWGNAPGQYRAELGRLPEGRYQVRLAGADKDDVSATAMFDVRGDLQERLEVAAQPETMRWIAEQSGGAVLESADPDAVARQFDQHLSRTRPERIARTTSWDHWWVLVGAFGLWALTWGLRRAGGLV
ncbi:MAG: VWA domain-containing protein [Thermoguttaceae bacterium]